MSRTLVTFGMVMSMYSVSHPQDMEIQNDFESSSENPTQNRLFSMPTGVTLPKGTFSVSLFEMVTPEVSYAPTDFLQFNLLWLPTEYSNNSTNNLTNLVVGVKVNVLPADGWFQGLSVSTDLANVGYTSNYIWGEEVVNYYTGVIDNIFDIYNRQSPNILFLSAAASFGPDRFKGHLSVGRPFYASNAPNQHFFAQAGAEYRIGEAWKAMYELFYNHSDDVTMDDNMSIIGFRFYNRLVAVDLGLAFRLRYEKLELADIPAFSLSFYF